MQVNGVDGNLSFKGMAVKAPTRRIRGYADAIAQWDVLSHPKFTNVFQEGENVSESLIRENKRIREGNYAFLDELTSDYDKTKFIEYFKQLTGFPRLKESSQRILEEFRRVLRVASQRVGVSSNDVLVSGYDKYCSVGLGSALPGSDLDKGYAIIREKGSGYSFFGGSHTNRFRGVIWDEIDNRIMSVNHCAAFPNIMTDRELSQSLNTYDKYAKDFVDDSNINFFRFLRMENGNPISGAKFNIWLSQRLPSKAEKTDAKNLAYVVEAIRDGEKLDVNYGYFPDLCREMNNSEFANCSNVCQGYQMEQKYNYYSDNMKKTKLRARQNAEEGFNSWSVRKQFELVKDIIRSMSGDNKNPEFNDLFYSKPDKHRLLINDILTGEVDCQFENLGGGLERTYLTLNTRRAMERYHDVNVYLTDY